MSEELPEQQIEAVAEQNDGWRRMHPLSPILQGGLVFLIIAGIILANLRDRIVWMFLPRDWSDWEGEDPIDFIFERNLWLVVLAAVVGVIAIVIVSTWLSWRFHTFRITSEAVETRKGVISRKSRRAPLDRIQSVNLQRPLLARMLGLTKIDVQTGGQGGNAQLAYLSHSDAKAVRDEILRLAGASTVPVTNLEQHLDTIVDEDISADAEESGALVRVPTGRLLGSTLLSNQVLTLILIIIAAPIAAIFWGWGFLAAIIPGVIVLAGVSFARFNTAFRFTLSETANGVRTGAGLTATSTETIPRHRIHAIDISQPIGWRFFGWWRMRVTTAGSANPGGSNSGSNQAMFQNVLLPVGHADDILRVLNLIDPDSLGDAEGLRDALDGSATGFTKSKKRAAWVLWLGRRRAGISLLHRGEAGAQVLIRRGFMTRHLVIMPLKRAQSVLFARPLVHYMLGLASLQVHSVMGPVNVTSRGLDRESAATIFDELQDSMIKAQVDA